MTFGSSFNKKVHCIHILWCIFMGLGHNDPWVESPMWPQQMWGQRSSRGQWPLVQVFAKTVTVSTYFHVCSGETCGSRITCFKKVLTILRWSTKHVNIWLGCSSPLKWTKVRIKSCVQLRIHQGQGECLLNDPFELCIDPELGKWIWKSGNKNKPKWHE